MKSVNVKAFVEDHFVLTTCVLSFVIAALYGLKGLQEKFLIGTWIVIGLNLLYIPLAVIFRRKIFSHYFLIYSLVMIFILAFEKTFLFNNFTALFLVCIIIMLTPKLEAWALIAYLVSVFVAFLLNEESLVHFLIHIFRSLWFVFLVETVLNRRDQKRKLVLYNDEKEILNQLCDGAVYQKEVRGFSENTVYRKLKAARERNGNISREELVARYKKEVEENQMTQNI